MKILTQIMIKKRSDITLACKHCDEIAVSLKIPLAVQKKFTTTLVGTATTIRKIATGRLLSIGITDNKDGQFFSASFDFVLVSNTNIKEAKEQPIDFTTILSSDKSVINIDIRIPAL